MGLLRYTASADNTIVNAYQLDLTTQATGANAGMADVLETFSIYGRISSASQELSRILIKFPVTKISSDRSSGTIPASGSVSFYLRMFNAKHAQTVPIQYKLAVTAVSKSWEEGTGLDLEGYTDLVKGNIGSDWIQASGSGGIIDNWDHPGGDYITASNQWDTAGNPPVYNAYFSTGLEDMEVDVTGLVEHWLAGDISNYGFGVHLSASYEASASQTAVALNSNTVLNPKGATTSYYTKRFFARGSQFFYKRPIIEARWDSTLRDDRTNFYYSSSRAPAADNLNTIYFYNIIRGRLRNIPNLKQGLILVSLYSGSVDNTRPSGSALTLYDGNLNITGGIVSTGIYSASIGIDSSSIRTGRSSASVDTLYDVWHSSSIADDSTVTRTTYFTGTIAPLKFETGQTQAPPVHYLSVTNLKNNYTTKETARINLYVRNKNWSPNIYTVANNKPDVTPITSASYKVVRLLDDQTVIAYGTGSDFHTGLSYDVSGNYFDFDMGLLEKGYAYGFKFAFYDDSLQSWTEQDEMFKFRVEEI